MKVLKRAVCVLLSNAETEVLAVSRKNNPDALGLPGGKVDPYETDEMAAIREVLEETGLILVPESLRQVYQGLCAKTTPDGEDYDVVTFTAEWSGTIQTKESGVVLWVPPAKLIAPGQPFRLYNWEVLRRLGVTP